MLESHWCHHFVMRFHDNVISEVLIIGSKGYLRAENGSIKGLLYNNNSNKDVGLEKENLLFEDTDPDTDLLLVDRNARNAIGNAVSSPLLPPIYMTGEYSLGN